MKDIILDHPHRKKHFDFFNAMDHPHFSITANVDISALYAYLKKEALPTHLTLVYLLARTANEIPEFRWRIRPTGIVEHAMAHPSFTVPTEVSDVFSFCSVTYTPHAKTFIKNAATISERMKKHPSLEDEPGKDDYLFLSTIPWVSFTGIQHAMHYHPSDSVPRIVWGKFFTQNKKTLMPLSVQAHHALVDGRHLGKFFQDFEAFAAHPEAYF